MRFKLSAGLIILCCSVLFSLFTVFVQVKELGLLYLEKDQLSRHLNVLHGVAGSPWQYRILSEYLVEWIIVALKHFGAAQPITTAFVSFRIFQNFLIFLVGALYYRKLGLSLYATLIGLSLLAWGMSHSLYDSDLQFNTYSDVIFYLAVAWLLLHTRYLWIVPLTGLAALNRETSALIPVMLFLHGLRSEPAGYARKTAVALAAVAAVLFAVIFVGLRYTYGNQPVTVTYGNRPGFDYLIYNFTHYRTWVQIFASFGVLPLMAIYSYPRWPDSLRTLFWAIAPIWLLVHPFVSIVAETRLLLVPFALLFVPGALFGMASARELVLSTRKNPVAAV